MMEADWSGAKNMLCSFFRNNHINQIVTFWIIVSGLYVSLISITGQNIFHPLSPVRSKTLDLTNAADEILHSFISCFMMIVLAIIVGKITKFVYIPSLIGCMLVGIAMRNVPQFGELFYINQYWQFILRKLALVVIIIRWGISINVRFMKKNRIFPPVLGILSASSEALGIFFAAHFIFNFPASLSLICGFVVATVSPAVSVPTMNHMRKMELGAEKDIPDIVPAACCFDNVFSLLIFSLTASVTFTHEAMIPVLIKSIGAIVLAVLLGCVIGWVIRWFPKNDNKHTNTARFLITASSAYGVITSGIVLGYQFPGICAALALCCVSATKWRVDNPNGIKILVHQYDNVWYYMAVPLLFSLVGYTFDFSELSSSDLKTAFALIAIGSFFRLVSSMLLAFAGQFNIYEQFILSLSLMPKATVQCALAPSLILLTDGFPELRKQTKLIINICIIAVIVTSPIVEILLDLLAPRFLKIRSGSSSFQSYDNVDTSTTQLKESEDSIDIKRSNPKNMSQASPAIYELNPNFMPIQNTQLDYSRPHYYYSNNNTMYRN